MAVIAATNDLPNRPSILVLTARGLPEDTDRAIAFGADTYMVKPFSVIELLARLDAMLRQAAALRSRRAAEPPDVYDTTLKDDPFRDGTRFGVCVYYPHAHVVLREGQLFKLSPRQAALLAVFLELRDQDLSREYLLWKVCRYPKGTDSRAIDQHVSALRAIIGDDPRKPCHIVSIRGRGYRFVLKP